MYLTGRDAGERDIDRLGVRLVPIDERDVLRVVRREHVEVRETRRRVDHARPKGREQTFAGERAEAVRWSLAVSLLRRTIRVLSVAKRRCVDTAARSQYPRERYEDDQRNE